MCIFVIHIHTRYLLLYIIGSSNLIFFRQVLILFNPCTRDRGYRMYRNRKERVRRMGHTIFVVQKKYHIIVSTLNNRAFEPFSISNAFIRAVVVFEFKLCTNPIGQNWPAA